MKVIATENGFFGRYIEKGETFEVPANTKGSWFAPAKQGVRAPQPSESEDTGSEGDKVVDLV